MCSLQVNVQIQKGCAAQRASAIVFWHGPPGLVQALGVEHTATPVMFRVRTDSQAVQTECGLDVAELFQADGTLGVAALGRIPHGSRVGVHTQRKLDPRAIKVAGRILLVARGGVSWPVVPQGMQHVKAIQCVLYPRPVSRDACHHVALQEDADGTFITLDFGVFQVVVLVARERGIGKSMYAIPAS